MPRTRGWIIVAGATLLESLLESPPEQVAVAKLRLRRSPHVAPVAGAVLPVWVTVRVPKAARAGEYRGRLTLRVAGEKPVTARIALSVATQGV